MNLTASTDVDPPHAWLPLYLAGFGLCAPCLDRTSTLWEPQRS